MSPAVVAQTRAVTGSISQPVVQSLPNRNSLTLNQALARLGQNPRDIDALIDAGNAALSMGDVDAAVGFFRRADQISPGNGRVKAGLAGALVHSENPFDAIPMFEEAERAGAGDGALAGERGLAYDLVGDNEKAQRYYRLALTRDFDDEITRRLALSYAIGGDRRSAEATLTPLLQRQDKAAWRTRAFALAILGQVDEAVSIANTTLPPALSAGISPYLRYMPRLTPAQQAAAANLGHFPRASEIGRDDPRVARYAPPRRNPSQQASADAALMPKGQPLGRKDGTRDSRRTSSSRDSRSRPDAALAANTAAPATASARQTVVRPTSSALAAASRSRSSIALAEPTRPPATRSTVPVTPPRTAATSQITLPTTTPRPAATSQIVLPTTTPRPAPAAPTQSTPSVSSSPAPAMATGTVPGPSLSISSPAVQGPPAAVQGPPTPGPAALSPVAPTPTPPAKPITLADAFSDFLRPPTIDIAPVPGAVDVRRLTPSRQAAAAAKPTPGGKVAPPKPPPPSHPSRIWVQLATGRDKAALAFDWRRMTREGAQALRGKQAFISAWGQTNRLLTGPFPTEAAANAFMASARRAGIEDSFLWTSPAGQVVDAIAAK